MRNLLKRIASVLPTRWQQALKRLHLGRAIRRGEFTSDEPEFARLAEWVRPGDWAVDVGANIGHYTFRLSQLVGGSGRVIALEPVPLTFELLAANAARLAHANVTLLNVAASDQPKAVTMTLPKFHTGLDNYYMASITEGGTGGLQTLSVPIDSLELPHAVSLIKLDVEGHELPALRGMRRLLQRDRPTLIVEGNSIDVASELFGLGYRMEQIPGSPNRIFRA